MTSHPDRPERDRAMPEAFELAADEPGLADLGEATLTNPAAVAALWLSAVSRHDDATAQMLGSGWTGEALDEVRNLLGTDWGLASRPTPSPDRPRDLVYMKVMRHLGDQTIRVFEPTVVDALIITLVRSDEGTWHVWGFGDYFSSTQVWPPG